MLSQVCFTPRLNGATLTELNGAYDKGDRMPPTALGLVLVAAILHAGWNLFVKRARQKQIFTWWALLVGVACFSPLLLMSSHFPIQLWFYAVCSRGDLLFCSDSCL